MTTEFIETLTDGTSVLIRPIREDDIERERAFVDGLSVQTKRFRFLGGVSHLTQAELQEFCAIDLDHKMAFVALPRSNGQEIQVGVVRYVADTDSNDSAEIALTVADEWKHMGLEQVLLQHLIDFARSKGIQRLYSMELASNIDFARLARECGFSVNSDPDDMRQVILNLPLSESAPVATQQLA